MKFQENLERVHSHAYQGISTAVIAPERIQLDVYPLFQQKLSTQELNDLCFAYYDGTEILN